MNSTDAEDIVCKARRIEDRETRREYVEALTRDDLEARETILETLEPV